MDFPFVASALSTRIAKTLADAPYPLSATEFLKIGATKAISCLRTGKIRHGLAAYRVSRFPCLDARRNPMPDRAAVCSMMWHDLQDS